jgi:hypothetical protein
MTLGSTVIDESERANLMLREDSLVEIRLLMKCRFLVYLLARLMSKYSL